MRATNWSEKTDARTAARRAGGRRRYNLLRQIEASDRLGEVMRLQFHFGIARGSQTLIAKSLGVSRSTICRDFKKLNETFYDYLVARSLGFED